MVRQGRQPEADREEVLECVQQDCPYCNRRMWNKYDNYRERQNIDGGSATTPKDPSLL
jgi:hypothetical protein